MSVTGTITISYPFWRSIDRQQTDMQDLLFNEPWFLIEGLIWAAIAWAGALRNSPWRPISMHAALAALTRSEDGRFKQMMLAGSNSSVRGCR